MTRTVLILGASGKIGRHSARAFAAAGWQVRRHDRQRGDMVADAMGADVIVNGMNPANYHDWAGIIPQITAVVIAAARASGASVILPGNVYHFGNQGGLWSEETPAQPNTRKGQIRLEMERAYAQSGVQTIVLRAGNFIDPDGDDCVMSLIYLRNIKRGRITLPGPANIRQAMCYLPDWADAAVALAEMRAELGRFEDIPFPGHTLNGQDIRTGLEAILGRDLRFARFPWGLMRLAAPFWEIAREMAEMRYLWETDHALSSRRFDALLPEFKATGTAAVLRAALPDGLLPPEKAAMQHQVL